LENIFIKCFENFPEPVIGLDKNNLVCSLNKAAETLFGPPDRSIGRNILLMVPGLKPATLTGQAIQYIKFHHCTYYVHVIPTNGFQVEKAYVWLKNITELENIKNKFYDSERLNEELETILRYSYDEIYVTDGNGITLRASESSTYYGVNEEEIIGKHFSELEQKKLFSPSVARMVLKEKRRVTLAQTTKTGKRLIVTGNPVFDSDGNIYRIVFNSRDITELMNLQQRLQEVEQLVDSYRYMISELKKRRSEENNIVFNSKHMQKIFHTLEKISLFDITVLITGETGVGKSLIASKIHDLSTRQKGPFIAINCGAIPENLLETELFGYEHGAFTGAKKGGKKGLFELAESGTIFLDEIGDLPLSLQGKLLQVIQEKKYFRIGGTKLLPVDVRIIAATNKNLKKMVQQGLFREDLYYRLNVLPVHIPPLRERWDDIPPLIEFYLAKFNKQYQMGKFLSPKAMDILAQYSWPGNVRELENLIEHLVITSEKAEISPCDLPEYLFEEHDQELYLNILGLNFKEAIAEVEKRLILGAYRKYGSSYGVANELGISQSTAIRKINKYLKKAD